MALPTDRTARWLRRLRTVGQIRPRRRMSAFYAVIDSVASSTSTRRSHDMAH